MIGTRYFDLRERFEFFDPTAPTLVAYKTRNHIIAAQTGFLLNVDVGHHFSVRWDGRAGVGANVVDRDTDVTLPVVLESERHESNAAFIGDTSLVLSYQLCCHVSAYAGYYLLWVDKLALAPQQFALPAAALTSIDSDGFVFFQGGISGVEVTW